VLDYAVSPPDENGFLVDGIDAVCSSLWRGRLRVLAPSEDPEKPRGCFAAGRG
jgi:hypothetical protein